MDYKDIAKYLQENIDGLYFGVECTCEYGETYLNKGEKFKFVMWRGIIITDALVLSIIPYSCEIEEKVCKQIFNLLETEFFHIGADEFDNTREFYKIKGIKSP